MQVFDSQSSYLPVKEQPNANRLETKIDILSTIGHAIKDSSDQNDIILSS